jgi:hypothetical protein
VRSESGDTTEIVTSTRVRKCNQSQDIRSESYLLTGVRHMTEVMLYLHYKHVQWIIYDMKIQSLLKTR